MNLFATPQHRIKAPYADRLEAELKGGVLTIVAPKRAEFQPRKVTVKSVIEKVKGAMGKEEAKA